LYASICVKRLGRFCAGGEASIMFLKSPPARMGGRHQRAKVLQSEVSRECFTTQSPRSKYRCSNVLFCEKPIAELAPWALRVTGFL